MKLLTRKILGPVTLLHLIALSAVSVVFGAVVLHYHWDMYLNAATPPVRFYKWSDGSEYGTITLTYNYYVDVMTIDENASYGIRNSGVSDKNVYLWVESACPYPSAIEDFAIRILNHTGEQLTIWWTEDFLNVGESNAVNWTAEAGGIDTIKVTMKGAYLGVTYYLTLRLKTDP